MLRALTITYLAFFCGAIAIAVLIVAVRATRTVGNRRRAALAAVPRRHLLAFVADGAEGADDLVRLPPAAWRAAEPAAVALLGKVRGEAHRALVEVFERRGAGDEALRDLRAASTVRRARAAEMLGNLGRLDAVPALCDLLADPAPEVRVVAVRALGRIGDPTACESLLAVLAAPQPAPSLLVAHALIQIGSAGEPALVAALDHPAPLVRLTALDALGLLGAAGATSAVAGALADDPDADVRVAAAATLGKLGTRGAVEPLLAALADDRPPALRAAAARALGELGASAAVLPLSRLLADPAYRVASEAAHALRRLGPAGLTELVRISAPQGPDAPTAAVGGAAAHAREALDIAALGAGTAAVDAGAPTHALATVG